jgi:hypothetical protein
MEIAGGQRKRENVHRFSAGLRLAKGKIDCPYWRGSIASMFDLKMEKKFAL